nr:MAG TPA: hypothetical protein [Ackermannviridae sp. ctjwt21]
MQAKFEQTAREVIVPKFNQLVDDLSNPSAASQIGANGKNRTVQGHIENLKNPHNVTAEQVGAYTKGQTDKAISDRIDQIGSADMTQAMYDPTGRQRDIFAYADSRGVSTYMHTKMDNVHHFNGSGTSGRVKMTDNVEAGDTVMLGGKEVPAYVGAETFADALAGEPVTGRWLTFTQDGEQINFNGGGGLSLTKLALADADTGDVISGKKFYSGDKTIKKGSILPRNTVGQNGAVGISQYYPSAPVTPVAANTQMNNNLDGVSRLCLQPPAGFYDGNSYVGETFAKVASAISLTAEKICVGNTVIGVKGTGVTKAVWHGSIPTDYSSHLLGSTPAAGTLLFLFAGDADHDMQIKSIIIGNKQVATPGRNNLYVATFYVSANQNIYMQWDSNFGGGTPHGQGVICYV